MLALSTNRLVAILAAALLGLPAVAQAQISVTFNFDNSTGFYTTERQAAIQAAGIYLRTQIDGRGTIDIDLDAQNLGFSTGGYTLAYAGTSYSYTPGVASTSNGTAYRQATSGTPTAPSGANSGTFNNNGSVPWYSGTSGTIPSGQTDMQSIALHEVSHVLGFASLINSDGSGLQGAVPGQPDTYGRLDRYLRAGPNITDPLLITASGTYNTAVPTSQLNSGNNYFFGEMAMAANGGNAVRMSVDNSHINASGGPSNAVMLPSISTGQNRRTYTNIDLAMLIDLGWNQHIWKGSTGNWGANINSATGSVWRNLDGRDSYSPVGTITTNMVLTLTGSTGYTSTNNLDLSTNGNRFMLTRLLLTATAGSNTLASNGTNVLRFDSTIGVVPQIRQDGAATFNISHPLELTGRNLQLAGDGTGVVTLSGVIGQQTGQTGALTKLGTSTFILSGDNTYSGGTTINAGTLLVTNSSGSGTGTGTVTVNGGTLGGTGRIGGSTTVTTGTLAPGSGGAGILTIDGNVVFASAGTRTLAMELNGSTAGSGHDQLIVNGTVSLNGATLNATRTGYTPNVADRLFILLNDGTDAITGTFNGLADGASFNLNGVTAYIYYQADFTSGSLTGGNDVVIAFTPVPEPTTVLAICVVGLALGGILRRRRGAAEMTIAA